tara:strand:+ start:401 stop:1243 length:843 start_codon:yes stop_codon:yes gene_type:complete
MNNLKLKNKFLGVIQRGNTMSKNDKKITFTKAEQISQVDDILTGSHEVGNKRIKLTTMIINTVVNKEVVLKYKNKTTNLEYNFETSNKVTNADVRGYVQAYKVFLGVDTLKEWDSSTDMGKERMKIFKESFWTALPAIKENCLTTNKSGKQFTGSKNSEIFIDGEYAKKYSDKNPKNLPMISMKFSDLKRASQNYYKDKSTNLSTNETSGTDNSFVASIKKMTRTINASKSELVLKKEQAGTEQAVQQLAIACNQWSSEFVKVRDSNLTPQQKVQYKKAI